MFEPQATIEIMSISQTAHWAIMHGIIDRLFKVFNEGRLSLIGADGDHLEQELYVIQIALHNWLELWMRRPEVGVQKDSEPLPPLMQNRMQSTLKCFFLNLIHLS